MSQSSTDQERAGPRVLGTRVPEIVVAAALALVALLVLQDSVRVGIGWAEDGPRSGYFPFYIGLMLLGASLTVLVGVLSGRRRTDPVFAERSQLGSVLAVLVPMVLYVGSIALIGIYLSSVLLIGYFMRRHGRFGWLPTAAVAVGVPLVLFLVFERWFLVPLPKGPIEQLLGF